MKKTILSFTVGLLGLSMQAQESIEKQNNGTIVIRTTLLGKNVIGYNGETPLEIYIKDNIIQKITPLAHEETPKYFARVQKILLPKYIGMNIKKAEKAKVDAVTGATMTSKAVKENIKRGIAYYKKNHLRK